MYEQIQNLLEKVHFGELSEAEARAQYLNLIETVVNGEKQDNQVLASNIIRPVFPAENHANSAYATRKIECINHIENPELRLFIFLPFGFGNEALTWSWKNAFSDQNNIEIWLMGASDFSDWQELTDYMVENIKLHCDKPFIVYGHSMGSIVAYETVVKLEQSCQLSPIVFIPSSVSPPEIFERYKILPPVYEIDRSMEMRECREILEKSQIILPLKSGIKPLPDEAIWCDLELIKSYNFQHDQFQLSCPILAIQANNDILIKDAVSLSLWKKYTKESFSLVEIEGSHLYFMNPPQSFFKTVKSFCKKENDKKNNLFTAATYQLVSFEAGTEEVHIYPFGTNPKGYLIYQHDGKMAAHLWQGSRNNLAINVLNEGTKKITPAEKILTYLSYTGAYQEDIGVIEHAVSASTDPNFDNDSLTRYFQIEDNTITLTTAPLTTQNARQSKSNGYSKLIWKQVNNQAKYADHWCVGSWPITVFEEDGNRILGDHPDGLLILTAEGIFSLVAVLRDRNRPYYDNLVLATNEELNDAIHTTRSCCGHFEVIDHNHFVFYIEQGMLETNIKKINIQLVFSQRQLKFEGQFDRIDKSKIHCVMELNRH
ncbi:MAG: lipocalin-like domain-containing protein [Burkholderiales bacterium]|nr:lipocalin-like domain-containing protein [Burkholderiales bacterium]MDR4516869.1 lipocalin-like domain-containing protein [Nitrosomonas sp.]